MIIFEDIDRYKDNIIFQRIREISHLINQRRKREISQLKKIKFIYAICDDIFEANDRTKFFDIIIPIAPTLHNATFISDILETLKVTKDNTSVLFPYVKEIYKYIDDRRLLNNILNEFMIYKNTFTTISNLTLFSLILYKNLFPLDYNQLNFNSSILNILENNKNKLYHFLTTKNEDKFYLKLSDMLNDDKDKLYDFLKSNIYAKNYPITSLDDIFKTKKFSLWYYLVKNEYVSYNSLYSFFTNDFDEKSKINSDFKIREKLLNNKNLKMNEKVFYPKSLLNEFKNNNYPIKLILNFDLYFTLLNNENDYNELLLKSLQFFKNNKFYYKFVYSYVDTIDYKLHKDNKDNIFLLPVIFKNEPSILDNMITFYRGNVNFVNLLYFLVYFLYEELKNSNNKNLVNMLSNSISNNYNFIIEWYHNKLITNVILKFLRENDIQYILTDSRVCFQIILTKTISNDKSKCRYILQNNVE